MSGFSTYTSLPAAQGKHLHAEDAKRVLAPQSLPDSQGLLGESLAFFKVPQKSGPHGLEGYVYIEIEWLPQLFHQSRVDHELSVHCLHITEFYQVKETPVIGTQSHLAVACLLGQAD